MKRVFNKGSVLNRCIDYPCPKLGIWEWGRFSCRIAISRVYFGHRKRPENKKLIILDKRCFNVQSNLPEFKLLYNLHYKNPDRIYVSTHVSYFIT